MCGVVKDCELRDTHKRLTINLLFPFCYLLSSRFTYDVIETP